MGDDMQERHTSEEEVDTAITAEVRADVGEITHRDNHPIQLSIYPGWRLRTPPRELWPPRPAWGDYQALWHQSIPNTVTKDFSYWSPDREVLIRFHAAARRRMYIPSESTLPAGLTRESLTGRRRTFIRFLNPVELEIEEDQLTDPRPQRQLRRAWVGRSEFQLRHVQR